MRKPEASCFGLFYFRNQRAKRNRPWLQQAADAAILKRLAVIDKTLLEHDSALRVIRTRLQPLLAPRRRTPDAASGSIKIRIKALVVRQ
jgi:hypothetical protein